MTLHGPTKTITIRREGNLLSVIHQQEVTDAQVNSVIALLKDETLTYGELLAFLAGRRGYDAPVGAGESVEAYRG